MHDPILLFQSPQLARGVSVLQREQEIEGRKCSKAGQRQLTF